MSKLACAEAIFDVLTGAGLDSDHDAFDEVFFACNALAEGRGGITDAVTYIEYYDTHKRDGAAVALDLITYARYCGCMDKPSAIIARAVAAGKEAL